MNDAHVFISYSRHGDSAAYTKKLADYLAEYGLAVWYDVDMVPGEQWTAVIQKKIATCSAGQWMASAGEDQIVRLWTVHP